MVAEDSETALREKMRKIERLFAGAGTAGERTAAGLALRRIIERLESLRRQSRPVTLQFSIPDPWSRKLFVALARRYGLTPYRQPRQKRQTVMLDAPTAFIDETLWPEFTELNAALTSYLAAVTDRIIREEVHAETAEPEERRAAPPRLADRRGP